jgi:hypothetical protein
VLIIGKIDRSIYSCISESILTDEVIITEERIEHIRQRHPNDYERFQHLLPEIVENPDYILEDRRPKTALVVKSFQEGSQGEHFRLALRLATSNDNPEHKNSIITFMKIREREFMRLVRNKAVLYKKE